ncbi:MAG: hypothetical protein SOZ59_10945 [Candidatus Limivivens sp.]|nr:hypothetical protein [Candidatus Limivivens sp.]
MERYSFVQWILFFYFYCFCGWIWESCYVSVLKKHWVNRGFLHGPLLPIYGFGAVCVLWVTIPARESIPLVFLLGMTGATILEYLTGELMERLFNVRYWDYSNHRFNVKGHICLACSIGWGFFSVALIEVIHAPVERLILRIPAAWAAVAAVLITAGFAADTVVSVREALDLKELLKKVTQNSQEFQRIQKRVDVLIAVVEDDKEKFRERLEQNLDHVKAARELEGLKQEIERLRQQGIPGKDRLYRQASRILKRNPGSISAKYKKALEEMKENFEKKI